MPSLWFIVPVFGRIELASICLRQLRRTCDALEAEGVRASAVVIGDDENLYTARDLGFGTIERDNRFTSRKFNDGIQLATDRNFNRHPVDYVVPCGSDDWVDWRLFVDLPAQDTVIGFQHMGFVNEDASRISARFINYPGGSGIRIYSRRTMARMDHRPAEEDRARGCDTSILTNVTKKLGPRVRLEHRHLHNWQIVDWKSPEENLNSYYEVAARYREVESGDPFVELAGIYPDDSLEEMKAHYAGTAMPKFGTKHEQVVAA